MSVGTVSTLGIFLDQVYSSNQIFVPKIKDAEEQFEKPADWNKGKAKIFQPVDLSKSKPTISPQLSERELLINRLHPFLKIIERIDNTLEKSLSNLESSRFEKNFLNTKLILQILDKIENYHERCLAIIGLECDKKANTHTPQKVDKIVSQYIAALAEEYERLQNYLAAHDTETITRFLEDSVSLTQTSSSSAATKTTTAISQTAPCLAYTRITKKWEETLKQRQNSPSAGTSSM